MKVSLRILLLTATVLFISAAPVYATKRVPNSPAAPNVTDVNAGTIVINLDATFNSTLGVAGIQATFHGTQGVHAGPRGFRVYGGLVDTNTGDGEFESVGDIQFNNGTTLIELKHLILDTTGALPVITAELLLNGEASGRVPLFTLSPAELFTAPLKGATLQSNTVPFFVNDSFVALFNSIYNAPVLTMGQAAGSTSVSATIGTIP